jgi:hypothetical protein
VIQIAATLRLDVSGVRLHPAAAAEVSPVAGLSFDQPLHSATLQHHPPTMTLDTTYILASLVCAM